MFIGILLILIGAMMLLSKFGIIEGDFGDYIVPVALVAMGASFIFRDKKDKK